MKITLLFIFIISIGLTLRAQKVEYLISGSNYPENRNAYLLIDNKSTAFVLKSELAIYYTPDHFVFTYESPELIVNDSIKNIIWNWDFQNEKDTFLGFECKKAIGHFNGRTYIAWYADTLSGGPWKARKLPGLILKLHDTDGVIQFEAIDIDSSSNKVKVPATKEAITYIEYVDWNKNFYRDLIQCLTGEENPLKNKYPGLQIEMSAKVHHLEPALLE